MSGKRSIVLFFFMMSVHSAFSQQFITYRLTRGRFGDNILNVLKCLWLAKKYNLTFLYKPFKNSDNFALKNSSKCFNDIQESNFDVVKVNDENDITSNLNKDEVIFETFFYTKTENDRNYFIKEFHDYIQSCFKHPIDENEFILPDDGISIAVHVRVGHGFDFAFIRRKLPLRFPPYEFYLKQIQWFSNKFKDKKLYFYIVTDHRCPKELIDFFKKNLNDERVIITRLKGPHSVVDDFLALRRFKYLIRPESAFSISAEYLGNHEIVIYPDGFIKENGKISIDSTQIRFKNYP